MTLFNTKIEVEFDKEDVLLITLCFYYFITKIKEINFTHSLQKIFTQNRLVSSNLHIIH
jgi:hypothetical protein